MGIDSVTETFFVEKPKPPVTQIPVALTRSFPTCNMINSQHHLLSPEKMFILKGVIVFVMRGIDCNNSLVRYSTLVSLPRIKENGLHFVTLEHWKYRQSFINENAFAKRMHFENRQFPESMTKLNCMEAWTCQRNFLSN